MSNGEETPAERERKRREREAATPERPSSRGRNIMAPEEAQGPARPWGPHGGPPTASPGEAWHQFWNWKVGAPPRIAPPNEGPRPGAPKAAPEGRATAADEAIAKAQEEFVRQAAPEGKATSPKEQMDKALREYKDPLTGRVLTMGRGAGGEGRVPARAAETAPLGPMPPEIAGLLAPEAPSGPAAPAVDGHGRFGPYIRGPSGGIVEVAPPWMAPPAPIVWDQGLDPHIQMQLAMANIEGRQNWATMMARHMDPNEVRKLDIDAMRAKAEAELQGAQAKAVPRTAGAAEVTAKAAEAKARAEEAQADVAAGKIGPERAAIQQAEFLAQNRQDVYKQSPHLRKLLGEAIKPEEEVAAAMKRPYGEGIPKIGLAEALAAHVPIEVIQQDPVLGPQLQQAFGQMQHGYKPWSSWWDRMWQAPDTSIGAIERIAGGGAGAPMGEEEAWKYAAEYLKAHPQG